MSARAWFFIACLRDNLMLEKKREGKDCNYVASPGNTLHIGSNAKDCEIYCRGCGKKKLGLK